MPIIKPFAIALCGLFLISCSNTTSSENKKTIGVVENIKNSSYEYSIGLGQTVFISITDVVNSFSDCEEASEFLSLFEEGILLTGLDENGNNVECMSMRLGLGRKSISNCSLKDGAHTIAITCKSRFESQTISKIRFSYKEKGFDLKTNINLKFNESYQNSPYLLDSYAMESRWWYSNALLLETDRMPYTHKNLESFKNGYFYVYDGVHHTRDNETIILNSISFSDNLKSYVTNVEYTLFDTNTSPFDFDSDKLEFKPLDEELNLKDITNETTELYLRFSTNELDNQAFLGGDIVYNVTINGVNYDITRMFLIHSYLLL